MFFVQVIEAPSTNGTMSDNETGVSAENPSGHDSEDTLDTSYSSQRVPLKSSEGSALNHEDTLEVH